MHRQMQLHMRSFVKPGVLPNSTRSARVLRVNRAAPTGNQEASTAVLTNVEVSFHIPHRVVFGQHICIAGGCDALGNWNPNSALPMEWTEGDMWVTACQLPSGDSIDYKYIIKSEFTSQIIWQQGSNMVIELPEAVVGPLEVQDTWDGHKHVILPASSTDPDVTTAPSIDDLLVSAASASESSTIPPVSLPITADADLLANSLLAKAMDEELVKTSIESMPLEKIKEMMTQHGLPAHARKEQMVDQLKQQLSKNGVASPKA